MMPGRAAFFAPVCAVMVSFACGRPAMAGGGHLYIYNWTDYTAPALIAKFEKETGIAVTVDTYDSNETLLAKMKAGSAGYDIIVASSDFVPILIDQGLIQNVDVAAMPGYANIEARWRGPAWDKGNAYTVPFGWGATAFAINTKYIKGPVDSLKTLLAPPPEAAGKVGMLGAPTEVMSTTESYLGLTPCQTDTAAMKQVYAVLEKQAPAVKVYASDGIIERLASGETWIQQTWNGDAARARGENPDIRFVFPKEGVVGWMDNLAVPRDARDPENAKAFLAFMLKPENSAISANFTHYASAIAGVEPFLSTEMKTASELTVPKDVSINFTPACPEAAIKLIDRVWTKLKR
jgi:spermidine/putrescine transport system substrate-binding protein